ncbi:hypothetical protein DCC81_23990 [Chitinophaga parva]|uniref:Uncharacterized protein n=1 Tax=Chitinophaga parva TaxID=2169414 RepID=A0A2T7BEC8_9BACT|nr:hypothetical protein [Chitinophaga parva]PUZ23443.1 hypothetical protein DCC81_23990 [Chitinophaga parva]
MRLPYIELFGYVTCGSDYWYYELRQPLGNPGSYILAINRMEAMTLYSYADGEWHARFYWGCPAFTQADIDILGEMIEEETERIKNVEKTSYL